MLLFFLSVLTSAVEIQCAQPRLFSFFNLETAPSHSLPLVDHGVHLQPPAGFTHADTDSKVEETIIDEERFVTEKPPLRKLDSKRIRMPRKFLQGSKDKSSIPLNEEFVIYVPEEITREDLLESPIIVPDLSEEELSEALERDAQNVSASTKVQQHADGKPVADQKVQETHHKKHKPKPKNVKFEKAGEKTVKADHYKVSKEKGHKTYKGAHKKHKVEKDHHAKAEKSGHFEDEGKDAKKFHHGNDYHHEFQEEDDGHNGLKFDEDGENNKGHNTKGTHNVNKKEEYVKKIEFFDEYHEDSDADEEGGEEEDSDYKKGGHEHGDHDTSGHHHDGYGEHKHHAHADNYKHDDGKEHAVGKEKHHEHDSKHAEFEAKEEQKAWKKSKGKGGDDGKKGS